MRQVEAAIRTFNLDQVKVSLRRLGVTSFGLSAAPLVTAHSRGAAAFLPRITVQLTVPDTIAAQVIEVLANAS